MDIRVKYITKYQETNASGIMWNSGFLPVKMSIEAEEPLGV